MSTSIESAAATMGRRGARALWDKLTPKQRSREMRRRRRLGLAKKKVRLRRINTGQDRP